MSDAISAIRADDAVARRGSVMPVALLRLASDQRLVEQVRAGSERAFEVLFDRYHRPVLGFCRHILGSHEEAEDVVQHTFLAAYRDLTRFEAPVALRPWLYAIARYRCLSVLRARREWPIEEMPERASEHLVAEVTRREDLRAIAADVARLPDDQRAALVLGELGDVSYEEIARILDCRHEKVKALVFQARSSLATGRAAREMPCAEIREQLATLHGGALRRRTLRRHLRDCPDCRAFRDELSGHRRHRGLLVPLHSIIGLKRALGALVGSGGGAGGAAVTSGVMSAGGLAATALVTVVIPVAGVVAAATLLHDTAPTPSPAQAATRAGDAALTTAAPGGIPAEAGHATRTVERSRGSTHAVGGPQAGERPAQAEANGNVGGPLEESQGGDPARSAVSADEAGAGGSPNAAGPPRTNEQVTAGVPAEPSDPSKSKGQVTPASPGEPDDPPGANGQVMPAAPDQADPPRAKPQASPATPPGPGDPPPNGQPAPSVAAKPSDPPGTAKGQPAPAPPAKPSDPPGAANGQSAPAVAAKPSDPPGAAAGRAAPPSPAGPDRPAVEGQPAPVAPAKPSDPAGAVRDRAAPAARAKPSDPAGAARDRVAPAGPAKPSDPAGAVRDRAASAARAKPSVPPGAEAQVTLTGPPRDAPPTPAVAPHPPPAPAANESSPLPAAATPGAGSGQGDRDAPTTPAAAPQPPPPGANANSSLPAAAATAAGSGKGDRRGSGPEQPSG
jgi:RNA polymerase sigma factor (sigma-70 family)